MKIEIKVIHIRIDIFLLFKIFLKKCVSLAKIKKNRQGMIRCKIADVVSDCKADQPFTS